MASSGLKGAGFAEHEIASMYERLAGKFPIKPEQDSETFKLDLTGKILFIGEMRGASQALQSLKLIYSQGRLRLGTVSENRQSETIELTGLRVIVTTTTSASFEDPELENQILRLQIDESETQTERIVERQAEEGEGLEEEED